MTKSKELCQVQGARELAAAGPPGASESSSGFPCRGARIVQPPVLWRRAEGPGARGTGDRGQGTGAGPLPPRARGRPRPRPRPDLCAALARIQAECEHLPCAAAAAQCATCQLAAGRREAY